MVCQKLYYLLLRLNQVVKQTLAVLMKKILVVLFLLLGNHAWVSAQEVTVAYITEPKTNAEWLKASALTGNVKYSLSAFDIRMIDRTISNLQAGKAASIVALATWFLPVINFPISSSPAIFGRFPASRRLNDYIELRRSNVLIDSCRFSPENFQHLLEAKRQLDKAQINSYVAMGAQIIGVIFIANLDDKGFIFSEQDLGIFYIPASINVVALGFNFYRLYKASRELNKIH